MLHTRIESNAFIFTLCFLYTNMVEVASVYYLFITPDVSKTASPSQ
uniref:Uncharacterized protein n=1 Tax=Lepeophtheirus salmonis TaxID=72036 RepID=A0A0K2T0K4_LEPSM